MENKKRYDNEELQAAYEYACRWVCDEDTAATICDSVGAYGSTYFLVSADEWYLDADWFEHFDCLIGEDVAIDHYVVALK